MAKAWVPEASLPKPLFDQLNPETEEYIHNGCITFDWLKQMYAANWGPDCKNFSVSQWSNSTGGARAAAIRWVDSMVAKG